MVRKKMYGPGSDQNGQIVYNIEAAQPVIDEDLESKIKKIRKKKKE